MTKKKEKTYSRNDIRNMMSGGNPNEEGIPLEEWVKRLIRKAEILEEEARQLRREADNPTSISNHIAQEVLRNLKIDVD